MFMCTFPENAIYCNPAHHVNFGGLDICITDSLSPESSSGFPYSYGANDIVEGDSNSYFAGSKNFIPKEVEVYKVIIS